MSEKIQPNRDYKEIITFSDGRQHHRAIVLGMRASSDITIEYLIEYENPIGICHTIWINSNQIVKTIK